MFNRCDSGSRLKLKMLLLTIVAVVNIDVHASAQAENKISLSGEWQFQTDPQDKGVKEQWFAKNLSDSINLPGSMAENLKGDLVSLNTRWTGSIYDSSFYKAPRLAKYRQPGNVQFPFWLTPVRHYVGAAWYQRRFEVSKSWVGSHVVLFLERAHINTRVWIDDKEIGTNNSLVAPHEYNITPYITADSHTVTVMVDNRLDKINVGPDANSVTDHTQGNWNGIIGKMELRQSPSVYVEDVQVYPDIANKQATVVLVVKNDNHIPIKGTVVLEATSFNTDKQHHVSAVKHQISMSNGEPLIDTLTLQMGDDVQLWDEFTPALYRLGVSINYGKKSSTHAETVFGMHEIAVDGAAFTFNGRPLFLRGTLNNCEFPLTGYPSTDYASWERIMKIAKSYGLNHMRFHSWCPPEAAFDAADRIGIYLQPEGPSWPNHGPKIGYGQPIDTFLYDETRRMIKEYGNHPSFCLFSAGNEPAGRQVPYLNAFVDYWKDKDSRRLYTGMSVGGSWPVVPDAQYLVRGGLRGVDWSQMPQSYSDYSSGISKYSVPFVGHEVGQYCAFPDFDEIKEYTGVYRAKNFELFKQDLADHGMADQAHDFLMASGKLQVLSYKHDIEKILRTGGYDGFQLLGLLDFPGQGTALVGVLNAFWKEKGYVAPDEFRHFCDDVVPLARCHKFVYNNNEALEASIQVSNFGRKRLDNSVFDWSLQKVNGEKVAAGQFDIKELGYGNGLPVGEIKFALNTIKEATRLKLVVSIRGTRYTNDWDLWVYPVAPAEVPADVYYTTSLDSKAEEVLNKGGKVFFNAAGQVVKGKEVTMYFQPVFWNTSWFKMRPPHVTGMLIQNKSAAFQSFLTDYYSDLQWWDIVQKAQVMNLEDFPPGFKPLVQPIDTWFMNRKLGLVFEARVGKGRLIVSSANLNPELSTDKPSSRQLFSSLMAYMNGDAFMPTQRVSFEVVKDLLVSPSKIQFDTYTTDSPDELKPSSTQNKVNN